MNCNSRTLVLAAALAVTAMGYPTAARADVERIREKALELDQKLNRHLMEIHTRGVAPKTSRVYKDFDFILKDSKVEEARSSGSDYHALGLADYLTRAIVQSELATYLDDLNSYLQTTTADVGGKQLTYSEIERMLAVTTDGAERRKIVSVMGPMVETSMVFRGDVAGRRISAYRTHGYADYTDFYGKSQGLDLEVLAAQADSVLAASQALYDTLLTRVCRRHLGMEPRQVKFQDLAYLTSGAMFTDLFPGTPSARTQAVYRGLGVDISGIQLVTEGRPGAPLGAGVFPVLLPNEVVVSLNPLGTLRDADDLVFAVGRALLHARSKDPSFEGSYLANAPAAAAVAWVPSLVLDEPGFIRAEAKGDPQELEAYLEYRAFLALFEFRALAGLTQFELHAYRGDAPDKAFRDHFGASSGIKLSQSDSHRGLDYLSQLQVASRFRGVLAAASMRDHLKATLGDGWYADGKAAAVLDPLWSQGGGLTLDAVSQGAGGLSNGPERRLDQIRALALEAGIQ